MIIYKFNFSRITSVAVILLLIAFLAACNDESSPTGNSPLDNSVESLSKGKGKVIHHVSLGGADLCEAFGLPTGCDANFSLTAKMHADGSVSGQWQDTFAGGGEGIHVSIDCLQVVGNAAIIGGVITKGTANGVDVSGQRALTAVVDNGTSKNDTPDQMSYSYFPVGADCNNLTLDQFILFDLTNGQVKVK
jgi:hypothetical protein